MMTDEEATLAARNDPDNPPLTEEMLDRGVFGRRVRRLRDRLGLSQNAFVERFHIPVASLRDWEQGRRAPDAATQAYIIVVDRHPDLVAQTLSAA